MQGVELQHLEPGLDHHHLGAQMVPVDPDHLLEQRRAPRDVVGRHRGQLALVDVDQRVPLLGLAVQALELLGRLPVAGAQLEHPLEGLDRPVVVLQLLLGQLGDLPQVPHAILVVLRPALGLEQDLQQAGEVARLLAERAVEVERRRVRGVGLADAPEVLLGRRRVVAHPPVHHPDLEQQLDFRLALRPRFQHLLVQHDEVVGIAGGRVVVDEERQRGGVRRRVAEHLLVQLGRPCPAARAARRPWPPRSAAPPSRRGPWPRPPAAPAAAPGRPAAWPGPSPESASAPRRGWPGSRAARSADARAPPACAPWPCPRTTPRAPPRAGRAGS